LLHEFLIQVHAIRQRIPQAIQRKLFLDKLSHIERPDLLKDEGSTRIFLILELFHSAFQLP